MRVSVLIMFSLSAARATSGLKVEAGGVGAEQCVVIERARVVRVVADGGYLLIIVAVEYAAGVEGRVARDGEGVAALDVDDDDGALLYVLANFIGAPLAAATALSWSRWSCRSARPLSSARSTASWSWMSMVR